MEDFSFVRGLDSLYEVMEDTRIGTVTSFDSLRDCLKNQYCLDSSYKVKHWSVKVYVPKSYSDLKMDWVLECL